MSADLPRINSDRLWESLMTLGTIGELPNGGVCRLALSDADKDGRDKFIEWCEEIDLQVRIDAIGNIFARRVGSDSSRKPIVTGSHLDTQPNGGRFDGAYGVMAGLEVMRTLNDADIHLETPMEIVVWMNEEGTRFAPSMMGSMVYTGLLDRDLVLKTVDKEGRSVGDELKRLGYDGGNWESHSIESYFEAHIEQGPILEREGCTIGVVTGGQGQSWYDVAFMGFAAHAGTTPMSSRKDALVGAAQAVYRVREIGQKFNGYATVGNLNVKPNSRNVIPDCVRFTIEIRHPDDEIRLQMETAVESVVDTCAQAENLEYEMKKVLDQAATPFDPRCVEIVRASSVAEGFKHMDIVSGAAHDAIAVANIAPTAMIFVPCKDGVSHNENESAKPEDLAAGCQVLLDSMLTRARE